MPCGYKELSWLEDFLSVRVKLCACTGGAGDGLSLALVTLVHSAVLQRQTDVTLRPLRGQLLADCVAKLFWPRLTRTRSAKDSRDRQLRDLDSVRSRRARTRFCQSTLKSAVIRCLIEFCNTIGPQPKSKSWDYRTAARMGLAPGEQHVCAVRPASTPEYQARTARTSHGDQRVTMSERFGRSRSTGFSFGVPM
jgi:hypothetical protein